MVLSKLLSDNGFYLLLFARCKIVFVNYLQKVVNINYF